jgi:hypothetical protein
MAAPTESERLVLAVLDALGGAPTTGAVIARATKLKPTVAAAAISALAAKRAVFIAHDAQTVLVSRRPALYALSSALRAVLSALDDGPATLQEISAATHLYYGRVSTVVSRLTAQGLVQKCPVRSANPRGGRSGVLVALTPLGVEALDNRAPLNLTPPALVQEPVTVDEPGPPEPVRHKLLVANSPVVSLRDRYADAMRRLRAANALRVDDLARSALAVEVHDLAGQLDRAQRRAP